MFRDRHQEHISCYNANQTKDEYILSRTAKRPYRLPGRYKNGQYVHTLKEAQYHYVLRKMQIKAQGDTTLYPMDGCYNKQHPENLCGQECGKTVQTTNAEIVMENSIDGPEKLKLKLPVIQQFHFWNFKQKSLCSHSYHYTHNC